MASAHGGGFVPYATSHAPQNEQHGGGYDPSRPYGQPSRVPGQFPVTMGAPPQNYQPHGAPVFSSIPSQPSQQTGRQQEPVEKSVSVVRTVPKGAYGTATGLTTADVNEYNGKSYRRPKLNVKGYVHAFNTYTSFLWRWPGPHFYRRPGWQYNTQGTFRHRDGLGRVFTGPYDDRYISPTDAKIKKLVVQATDEIYDGVPNSTWRRTFIRNRSPIYLRVANWATNHVDVNVGPQSEDWPLIILKWIPASLLLSFVLGVPRGTGGQARNSGRYDPFPYQYYGYPKTARNTIENIVPRRGSVDVEDQIKDRHPIADRPLRPRYLCVLGADGGSTQVQSVDEWAGPEVAVEYLFVAYTAQQFNHSSQEDVRALFRIAEKATRDAGLSAFWLGCSCMPDQDSLEQDVYRISDVIRGARATIIAVSPSPSNPEGVATTNTMLMEWGDRIWTFPEVLLSRGKSIKVYTRGREGKPEVYYKNQFAASVWSDAPTSRQLIDHYEGSIILTNLELISLALGCLSSRRTKNLHLPGDRAYALMGLLRLRPRIDRTDSAFQAFARLSLANDSDHILERIICMLPSEHRAPWYSMKDAYHVNLWDIEPSIQIAGIGQEQGEEGTIIIDGCRGANIRWKCFEQVANTQRLSWKALGAYMLLRTSGYQLYTFIILAAILTGPVRVLMIFLLIWSLLLVLASPILIRLWYSGKFWATQPWLFGFEGHMDIQVIEKLIFGTRIGRLSWSPWSSPFSRHYKNEDGEVVGLDPIEDPETRRLVEQASSAKPGQQRIFTLVDTNTMTVTLFQAANPPVGLILCGVEGGMQRALGVSYDWPTGTLYRETVLRVETPVTDLMDMLPRLKLGLQRPQPQATPVL